MKNEKSAWEKLSTLIARPSIAVIGISLVLFVNAYAIFNESFQQPAPEKTEMAVADEYSGANSYFSIENGQN